MKKRKYAVFGILCVMLLLIYPLYAGIYTRTGNGEDAGEPVGECPKDNNGDDMVLLPDSKNCAIFYKCDWGIPVPISCPDILYFNAENGTCDFEGNVDCDRTSVRLYHLWD